MDTTKTPTQRKPLSPAAIQWLAYGERGTSSNTIFTVLTGVDACGERGYSHPCDSGDFARCRRLIEAVPEFRAELHHMKKVSPVWTKLVDAWDSLCATMDEEAPGWRSRIGRTPRTYAMLKELGC